MRWFVYSVLLVMSVMLGIACTAVSPNDCFPNTSAGFGGGGPIPIGNGVGATTGDFGAPPSPGPLGAGDKPNPCIVQDTDCNEQCNKDYENAAIVCGKIPDAAQRLACQDAAYANYKICRGNCAGSSDCREACKAKCDSAWERCREKCPKGDKSCLNQCSQEYGKCLKDSLFRESRASVSYAP